HGDRGARAAGDELDGAPRAVPDRLSAARARTRPRTLRFENAARLCDGPCLKRLPRRRTPVVFAETPSSGDPMHVNRWKLAGSAALLAAALTGCGGPLKYAVHGSPKAPEMDANIVADVNKDGNFTNLKIDIEHLAPPDRL